MWRDHVFQLPAQRVAHLSAGVSAARVRSVNITRALQLGGETGDGDLGRGTTQIQTHLLDHGQGTGVLGLDRELEHKVERHTDVGRMRTHQTCPEVVGQVRLVRMLEREHTELGEHQTRLVLLHAGQVEVAHPGREQRHQALLSGGLNGGQAREHLVKHLLGEVGQRDRELLAEVVLLQGERIGHVQQTREARQCLGALQREACTQEAKQLHGSVADRLLRVATFVHDQCEHGGERVGRSVIGCRSRRDQCCRVVRILVLTQ
mmetsp:Transcript_18914/g.56712  ORF Transcript_18914/g.56712 Transcript_18914/m.56712 type:complete len:262 (+) Transcript_18914:2322-3107(+)